MTYNNSALRTIQDSERRVLCSMLENKEILKYATNVLMTEDFYFNIHAVVFAVLNEFSNEDMDFTLDDIIAVVNEMNNSFNFEAIRNIFVSVKSANPKNDIQIIQENGMNRYILKNKISKENVIKMAIEDKYYFWSVMYINDEIYEIETIAAGDIPSEFQSTFSLTMDSIKDIEFSSESMLPWNEDTDSITKFLFVR